MGDGLTDDHYTWTARFTGIDPRPSPGAGGNAGSGSAGGGGDARAAGPDAVATLCEIKFTGKYVQVFITPAGTDKVVNGKLESPLYIGDKITVGLQTLAAVEFVVGGRAGIDYGTSVEIVTDRSLALVDNTFSGIVLHKMGVWGKEAKTRAPLHIQTNGGAMSIKG